MPDATVSNPVDVFMLSADQAAMKTNVGLGNVPNVDTTNAGNISNGTLPDGRFPATLPAASGANLTSLNASNLASGTVPDARFPATLPAASGANLTSLNASNLASGTVPDARFPATLPAASGANLTNLNASNLASGTVPAARLPAPGTTTLGGVKRNTGSAGQYVTGISSTGDLEYDTPAGAGTVTSVDVSGGTTGLTTSGGPVTGAGTITIAGTLAVANGGTGATDATTARSNLGLAIGTNVQAYNANTTTLGNTTTGTDSIVRSTSPTIATPIISGAVSFPDDVRQTFNPGATNAGLNTGSHASDPSSLSNGDLWYNSTSNELKARINGSSVALGAGGGGGGVLAYVKAGKGGTDQTGLGNGGFVEVTWPVEDADTGNNFASNTLTVGSGQMWYLSAYITTLQATNANLVRLAVYKDGSYYQDLAAGASYASGAGYGGSCFLTAAGDYTIRAYSPGGQSLGAAGTVGLSWLEAQRFA